MHRKPVYTYFFCFGIQTRH